MTAVETQLPVVTLSDAARATILGLRAAEPEPEKLALRIDVVGVGESGTEYAYELTFESLDELGEGDVLAKSEALPVIVGAESVDKLRGSSLDEVEGTGLVLKNPNRPRPEVMATGPVHLEGSVAEKIQQLLDAEINPQLAMHGGFAALDRVEDDLAYLTMGGGCQGCGLAQLTLTEGIKATIEKEIPEIREVIDITDHSAGDNPFYEPGAK
ncbi:MAG TPA: NifU family protein [Acidimicrobiales bacterium]|nr:NifU family protein [Acidimicrobiales bacterium]